jgi:hypothetical protein
MSTVYSQTAPVVAQFRIWKTIKLGLRKNADAYRTPMRKARLNIGSRADDILDNPAFTASETKTKVDLVVASVAELGFKEDAMYSEICARAKELGLDLCPAEVGPALRLAYKDQQRGEWLIIAMEAITTDSDGGLGVFVVEHISLGPWLYSGDGHPGTFWACGHRFVFVRCRK